MKKRMSLITIISLTANIAFICFGIYFVIEKGGITYIERRISPAFFELFSNDQEVDNNKFKNFTLLDEQITVNGLPGFNKGNQLLHRLPEKLKSKIRPILWYLGEEPSGGRIRFRTDSRTIGIIAFSQNPTTPHHMNSIMKNGIDIYVNNIYSGSAWPDKNGKIIKTFEIESGQEINNIIIYLPLYESIKVKGIQLENDSNIYPANDLSKMNPIIYYGSSITQGAASSNPGLSYPAILSRRTGVDFINLGFSGNGIGDSEIAQFITTLDASLIILDYWANPSSDIYRNTLPLFVEIIRKTHKNTPILIISPLYSINRGSVQNEKREITIDFVKQRKSLGDKNVFFFDGTKMLSKENAYGLVDGRHLNSLGFWFCANALEPKICELLHLELPDNNANKSLLVPR